jgi:hypothetical protein
MFKKLAFGPSPHVRTRPPVHPAPSAHRPTTAPITPFLASFHLRNSQKKPAQKSVDFAKDQ